MFITICVIAYNEENTLKAVLQDIKAQDYEHNDMEVLLVDSASTDGTRKIMHDFAKENTTNYQMGFRDVKVLQNTKRTLPCGWNVALKAFKGEAILKIDAHASIPVDFVRKNVEVLESGEDICGGQRPNIVDNPTPFRNTLLLAETSMFGSSIAPYRNNPGRSYVKSMFHAAYRRKVFDKTGGFNENLARTEDNEMHYRMRKAGFKLCFEPQIISYQHTRSSLPKMLKQKYANGYWIGLTSGVCPQCLSLYHFVPFVFVLAILLSLVCCAAFGIAAFQGVAFTGVLRLFYKAVLLLTSLMWGLYWLLAVFMALVAVISASKLRNITCLLLPVLFFLLHISYGIGTMAGLIKMPFWVKGIEYGRN